MTRPADRSAVIDESWLVWVAAAATGTTTTEVLATMDVRALAELFADVDSAGDPLTRAARLLEGVLLRRPFANGNKAIAWLAAAMALTPDDRGRAVPPDHALALVQAVIEGTVRGPELVDRLGKLTSIRRMGRTVGRCPACDRELHVLDHEITGTQPVLIGWSAYELVGRCWYEHRAHDRRGRTIQVAHPEPIVLERDGAAAISRRSLVSG